uniref:Putative kynurenine aminotransferase n=1 Tax=Trypanosoma congolense (strain IL3000) TaxID=1068625 RepID=G0UXX1_TRYCI|nr:putative kynurenine aminotransferase [Trypanosoma congolense IL3000]
MESQIQLADRLSQAPKVSVWTEMTPLANKHGAVNLGQGFPNFPPPDFLLQEVHRVFDESIATPTNQQYARTQGNLELVEELKRMYAKQLNWPDIGDENVVITNGTTQGLNMIFQATINPGDEVIIFEPFYDAYVYDIQLAGGVVKYAQMEPGSTNYADSWTFNEELLRSLITPRTKAILINTPQNVPGKAWTPHELGVIASLAVEHNILVISDEVYMTLVYETPHPVEGKRHSHISIASLPGMRNRCVSLCSAGKTFSCTGWKIGWVVGPANIITALSVLELYQTFSVATPLQIATARGLRKAEEVGYYKSLLESYEKRRTLLCDVLTESKLPPIIPSGGFFVLADISRVDPKHYYDPSETLVGRDWQFCRWMTRTIKVCAIPMTAFCQKENRPLYERYVRFAYCKREEDIEEARKRLQKLGEYLLPE